MLAVFFLVNNSPLTLFLFHFNRDLLQDEEIDPNCPGEEELTALHIAM